MNPGGQRPESMMDIYEQMFNYTKRDQRPVLTGYSAAKQAATTAIASVVGPSKGTIDFSRPGDAAVAMAYTEMPRERRVPQSSAARRPGDGPTEGADSPAETGRQARRHSEPDQWWTPSY